MSREFSAYGFQGEIHTNRLKFVSMSEAIVEARVYARSGQFDRVIVTDGGDCTIFEWLADKGIVFPKPEDYSSPEAREEWYSMFPKKEKA